MEKSPLWMGMLLRLRYRKRLSNSRHDQIVSWEITAKEPMKSQGESLWMTSKFTAGVRFSSYPLRALSLPMSSGIALTNPCSCSTMSARLPMRGRSRGDALKRVDARRAGHGMTGTVEPAKGEGELLTPLLIQLPPPGCRSPAVARKVHCLGRKTWSTDS